MDGRRFDELLQRWQDGDATAPEIEELGSLLRQDPLRRRELVISIRLELNLHRKYTPAKTAAPARRWRWEAIAAVLVLALSVFLVGRLLLIREQAPAPSPMPALPPKFMTPERTTITLVRAIELAVAAGGGIPVHAELEEENREAVYSVALAVGNRTREIELEIESGRVVDDQAENDDKTALVEGLKVPLTVAIQKALEAVPGRAMEAEAEIEGGKVIIEVRILAGGALKKIVVDGGSGQILRR